MALFYRGIWLFLLLTLSLILAEGGKILVVPQDGSHWLSMRPVVEKLQQKGHEVVVVVPATSLYMKSKEPQNYTVKVYPIPYTDEYLGEMLKTFVNAHFIEQSVWNVVLTSYKSTIEISSVFFTNCKSLLQNEELMQYLKESKFDVVFTDPILMCGPLVAEYLSVPSIYFLRGFPCGMDSAATQCPSPASYVPRLFLDNSDSMMFSQRVKNMLVNLLELFYCKPIYDNFEELAYELFKKKVTATELLSRGSFWLMRYDFVFEFPRPVMPNMAFIGGINCVQKKRLSQKVIIVGKAQAGAEKLSQPPKKLPSLRKGKGIQKWHEKKKSSKDFNLKSPECLREGNGFPYSPTYKLFTEVIASIKSSAIYNKKDLDTGLRS